MVGRLDVRQAGWWAVIDGRPGGWQAGWGYAESLVGWMVGRPDSE